MLGKRLRRARKEAGLSRRRTAEKTGFSIRQIFAFEAELSFPTFGELAKLAEIYKRDTEFFLSDTEPPKEQFIYRG